MDEILDTVPPVVRLLSSYPLTVDSIPEAIRCFHDLLPELRTQAEWSYTNFIYSGEAGTDLKPGFISNPVSGLNPFSQHGKCSEPSCRIANARRFAQTLGLYSDRIIIPDPFTTYFLDDSEWSNSKARRLMTEVLVLQELMPLVECGVIQFINPLIGYCEGCYKKLSLQVMELAGGMLKEFGSEIEVVKDNNKYVITTGQLYSPPLHHLMNSRSKNKKFTDKRITSILLEGIAEEIKEILFSIQNETSQASAIFSNSRIALTALRELEGHKFSLPELDVWETAHSANLPWVKDLSVTQIVQLRHEAEKALPQLRETLARSLGPNPNDVADSLNDKSVELVRELRMGAEEAAAELMAINIKDENKFHNVAGLLGLTVSVYGFGADMLSPAAAMGTLLTTLGLIHTVTKKDQQDIKKITTKPGYVLVKAKDLLNHAD